MIYRIVPAIIQLDTKTHGLTAIFDPQIGAFKALVIMIFCVHISHNNWTSSITCVLQIPMLCWTATVSHFNHHLESFCFASHITMALFGTSKAFSGMTSKSLVGVRRRSGSRGVSRQPRGPWENSEGERGNICCQKMAGRCVLEYAGGKWSLVIMLV